MDADLMGYHSLPIMERFDIEEVDVRYRLGILDIIMMLNL